MSNKARNLQDEDSTTYQAPIISLKNLEGRCALRYALKIGLLALDNPELTVKEIKDILEAQVDYETGRISELNPEKL